MTGPLDHDIHALGAALGSLQGREQLHGLLTETYRAFPPI